MIKWSEIIKEKYDTLVDVCIETYKDARKNTHLEFIVEMDKDIIRSGYCVAGSHSFSPAVFTGNAIEIMRICFQCEEIQIPDEMIVEKLKEHGYNDWVEPLQNQASDLCIGLQELINSSYPGFKNEILPECIEDELDADVSEYGNVFVVDLLDEKIKEYENEEENE